MALKRKDFIEFAELIAKHNPTKALVEDITHILARSNNRFDKLRFMDYIEAKSKYNDNRLTINNLRHKWGVNHG
jgi:hypothetical protein